MSEHTRLSQARLHTLFRGFADIVGTHITHAAKNVLADRPSGNSAPLRVLDLGAGSVPYERAFRQLISHASPHSIEITFVDKNDDLPQVTVPGCESHWQFVDALTLIRSEDPFQTLKCPHPWPYDLVIM